MGSRGKAPCGIFKGKALKPNTRKDIKFQWIFQTSKLNIPDKIKDEIKNKIKEIEKYDIQVFNSLLTHMDSVNKEAFSEEIKQAIKEKMINIFLMLKDLKMRYSNTEASNIKYIASENHYLVFRILLDEYFNKNERINAFVKESNKNYETTEEMVKYQLAIAISRFVYDSIGEIPGNFDQEKIKNIIKEATDAYLQMLEYSRKKT